MSRETRPTKGNDSTSNSIAPSTLTSQSNTTGPPRVPSSQSRISLHLPRYTLSLPTSTSSHTSSNFHPRLTPTQLAHNTKTKRNVALLAPKPQPNTFDSRHSTSAFPPNSAAVPKPTQSIRTLSKVVPRNPIQKRARSPSSLVEHDRNRQHSVSQSQSTPVLPKLPQSSSQLKPPQKASYSPKIYNSFYTSPKLPKAPTPLQTLPKFIFADRSHFSIKRTAITRTEHGQDEQIFPARIIALLHVLKQHKSFLSLPSSVFIRNPFTSGVVSITITILSSSNLYCQVNFGLMDSKSPIPKIGEILGAGVKDSVGLDQYGSLWINTPSSDSGQYYHSELKEGDCVRMEVDLDSTPRTVQFFVNGEAGECYVSGIPSSVRIGFSVRGPETAFRIDNISRLPRSTPILEGMRGIKWRA
ncbi:hypothetical protein BLNAU_7677 [Blattamonas nauphoetae]|uniref:B30.2/SPRY domain-containing protein n=1 Tax=Blattamonas nauphoetae TaxID=2049346 RepID=A0ABQ9Y0P8_9EUKA|nr:hypothetical protein BLNAU_7677 [Blattamonas nauphoetae]